MHQAIGGGPPPQAAKAAPLPAYIRRPHDERLRAVLDPATTDRAPTRTGGRSSPPRWTLAASAMPARCPPRCCGTEAIRTLATRALRAADAGMFGLFLEARPGEAAAYRFGREPDGTPSPPWSWSERGGVPGLPL